MPGSNWLPWIFIVSVIVAGLGWLRASEVLSAGESVLDVLTSLMIFSAGVTGALFVVLLYLRELLQEHREKMAKLLRQGHDAP